MNNLFNIINFTNYYAFIGLLAIPVIILVIKLFPPTPNKVYFSSLFLIQGIDHSSTKKFKTPLWLLLFRILFIFIIILFFSKPYLNYQKENQNSKYDDYVIIANMGWSTAKEWTKYKSIILRITKEAEKKGKKIILYHSGLSNYNDAKTFQTINDIKLYLNNLEPVPWQLNNFNLYELNKNSDFFKNSKVFLLTSKFDFTNFSDYLNELNIIKNKAFSSIIIDPIDSLLIISDLYISKNSLNLEVRRLGSHVFKQEFFIKINTYSDEIIYKKTYTINENQKQLNINKEFPLEIINQIKSIEIIGQNHAAAKYFFDDYSKKRNIAIVDDNISYSESSLFSSVYYLKKSLNNDHILKLGKLDKFINNTYSVIILPDDTNIPKNLYSKLEKWIKDGGTLIRFSGESLVKSKAIFTPANNSSLSIRYNDGKLNLKDQISISTFDRESIFFGLKIPKDINISKQLIFNSNSDQITYIAKLTDNTPLVSMRQKGDGRIILFHIGANNKWSDLPLSSLFPNMLERLLLFSRKQSTNTFSELSLVREINGFGKLVSPKKIVSLNNTVSINNKIPSKELIPGIYENNEISIAVNLATKISTINLNNEKINNKAVSNDFNIEIKDLSSLLLKIILIMFILDILITILIKNNIKILNYAFFKK